jgi:carbon monoxide dehydrogenase subunit G
MEVKLEKVWPLEATRDQAWAVLSDVRAVAACMPGAQITEQVDATHYKGQVRSKVGPALMVFLGEVEVLALDPAAMRLEMMGKGADKGGSAAAMKLAARLEPGADPDEAILAGEAIVTVSGKLAQFGGRLLVPVADAMLAQFAEHFQAAAAQVSGGAAAPAAGGGVGSAPAAGGGGGASAPDAGGARADGLSGADGASAGSASATSGVPGTAAAAAPVFDAPADAIEAATAHTPPPPAGTVPVTELNVLSLAWTIVRGWLRNLLGRKAT